MSASSWLQEDLIHAARAGLQRRGWPQVRLAMETGYSEKHISQVLNGRVEGSLAMWSAILEVLLVDEKGWFPVAEILVGHDVPLRGA